MAAVAFELDLAAISLCHSKYVDAFLFPAKDVLNCMVMTDEENREGGKDMKRKTRRNRGLKRHYKP